MPREEYLIVGDTMGGAQQALRAWYAQPEQELLKNNLRQRVTDQMEWLFGYHALQIGLSDWYGLGATLNIPQRVALETSLECPSTSIQTVQGLPSSLPFQSDVFDVIFLPHTLEWVDDLERTWMELHRVLRPQGTLIILGVHPDWKYLCGNKKSFQKRYPWVRESMTLAKMRSYSSSFGFCEIGAYAIDQVPNPRKFLYPWMFQCVHLYQPYLYLLLVQKQVYAPNLIRPSWSSRNWLCRPITAEYRNETR